MLSTMYNYMRKIPTSEHGKIVRLYGKMGAKAIGDKYGVSHQAILDILRINGVKVRKPGKNVNGRAP